MKKLRLIMGHSYKINLLILKNFACASLRKTGYYAPLRIKAPKV